MNVEVLVENDSWNEERSRALIIESTEEVFSFFNLKHDDIEICFLCTDDSEIRTLNKTYRGIYKATNVLSFPGETYHDKDEEDDYLKESDENFPQKMCILGSVALSFETIVRESDDQGKTFENHLRHLIVHSVLHLLGYDHIEDEDAEKMENLEVQILRNMGISDPYQEI